MASHRLPILATALVCAAGAPAMADDEHDVAPVPKLSVTLDIIGHVTKMSGLEEGGWGPNLEFALGHRRWQYFAELGMSRVSVGPDKQSIDGNQLRGGIGVRWLARSFELDEGAAVEMNFEAVAGVQKFWWDDGNELSRPDIGVGVGWQLRKLTKHTFAFRSGARVMFAPTDREAASALCRGTCKMPASTASSGLMAVFGVQW